MLIHRVIALGLVSLLGAAAQAQESNRFCDPAGFCVETNKAFSASSKKAVDFDIHRLQLAEGGTNLTLYVGGHPDFPQCKCEVRGAEPDISAIDVETGKVVERRLGPFKACNGRSMFAHVIAAPESEGVLRTLKYYHQCP